MSDDRCKCPSRLIDYVRRTVGHPFIECPYFGTRTPLDDEPVDEPLGSAR